MAIDTSVAIEVPSAPPVRARRNPKWIALGVVALCLGALGAFFLYTQLSNAQAVVAVKHTVHRGTVIEQGDLTTVTVGNTPGIRTVPASQLAGLIGQRAAFDLVAGSLLSPDSASGSVIPAPERSVVGIRVVSGRVPSGLIPPSARIRLIAIPPAGADPSFKDGYSNRAFEASLVGSVDGVDGVSVVLNVDVPADQAAAIGLLAAQERLVVIWDAER